MSKAQPSKVKGLGEARLQRSKDAPTLNFIMEKDLKPQFSNCPPDDSAV